MCCYRRFRYFGKHHVLCLQDISSSYTGYSSCTSFPDKNLITSSKERSLLANASINSLLRSSSRFCINFSSLSNSFSYLSFAFETTSFCDSFFLSEHFFLPSFLSFFLYLHQVFIHCSSLGSNVCRRHVKCLQDFFLRDRNCIIHAVSQVALADQFYLFQFP